MNSEGPFELIVAAFADETGAHQALGELKQAKREHLVRIREAAIVRRNTNGRLHVHEHHDLGTVRGVVMGAMPSIIAGMFLGPLGGIGAHELVRAFTRAHFKQLGDALTPGSSAIAAVVEPTWGRHLRRDLEQLGATVATEDLAADVHAQLVEGHSVAYDALVADGAIAVERTTDA